MLPSLNLVNGFDIRAERGWLQWLRIESDWLAFVSWAQPGGHSPFLIGFRREAFPHSSWVKRENTEVVFILWRWLHTLIMASEKVRVWPGWKCLGKLPQCYSSGRDKLCLSSQTAEALLIWKEIWLFPAWLERLVHAMQIPSAGAWHNQCRNCFRNLRWDRS